MSAPFGEALRLCLVTDRAMAGSRPMAAIVAEAVAGGVTMVQLREKTAGTRAFVAEAEALLRLLRPHSVPLVINDRVDVALAVGAEGVHVGQDDMPVALVRRLVGPAMLIGLSITSDADLAREDAGAADYLGIGPVFAQATKPDASPPLGLAGLTRLASAARRPVLAIGGLDAGNAAAVRRAGAGGVAVVSAIMAAPDPRAAALGLSQAVR